ncbi:hypothetical protein KSP39_PZI002241 [Platanthera zijinensis]|uniref:Uncharacterized protein n=1 Tax=Platanthera zijinensis TaxID=2320716 RepID=A0AAP0BZX0_9ASPA
MQYRARLPSHKKFFGHRTPRMLKLLIFLKLEVFSACQSILWIHFYSLKSLQKILWIALGK